MNSVIINYEHHLVLIIGKTEKQWKQIIFFQIYFVYFKFLLCINLYILYMKSIHTLYIHWIMNSLINYDHHFVIIMEKTRKQWKHVIVFQIFFFIFLEYVCLLYTKSICTLYSIVCVLTLYKIHIYSILNNLCAYSIQNPYVLYTQ